MMDVPLLALLLGAFGLLLRAVPSGRIRDHLGVSALLSVAVMVKYVALPLVLVHGVLILLTRRWRALVVLLLPMTVLGAWSWWNVQEFGSPHLFTKSGGSYEGPSLLDLLACIGGLSCVAPMLYSFKRGGRAFMLGCSALLALIVLAGISVAMDLMQESAAAWLLTAVFLINGTCLTGLFMHACLKGTSKNSLGHQALEEGGVAYLAA